MSSAKVDPSCKSSSTSKSSYPRLCKISLVSRRRFLDVDGCLLLAAFSSVSSSAALCNHLAPVQSVLCHLVEGVFHVPVSGRLNVTGHKFAEICAVSHLSCLRNKGLPHLCELWLKTQTKNVRLQSGWTCLRQSVANIFQCITAKMKCKTSQTVCSHPHYSQQKNNHATSNAFMATFTMPLAKVVLYIAVSGQFTSFMGACWLKHVHCPKCSFMILTNG